MLPVLERGVCMNNYIDLNIRELIDNCCDDKDKFINNMNLLKESYNKKIHKSNY